MGIDQWVTVNVSTELLAGLSEWSEPVQVRVEKVDYGTGWEMIFQRAGSVISDQTNADYGVER